MAHFQRAIALRLERKGEGTSLADAVETSIGGQDVLLVAGNNLAVCALHCCELREAVGRLEALIRSAPRRFLRPATVFNLCTLYDLANNVSGGTQKKRVLRALAERYGLDDCVPREAFRLPELL